MHNIFVILQTNNPAIGITTNKTGMLSVYHNKLVFHPLVILVLLNLLNRNTIFISEQSVQCFALNKDFSFSGVLVTGLGEDFILKQLCGNAQLIALQPNVRVFGNQNNFLIICHQVFANLINSVVKPRKVRKVCNLRRNRTVIHNSQTATVTLFKTFFRKQILLRDVVNVLNQLACQTFLFRHTIVPIKILQNRHRDNNSIVITKPQSRIF